MFIFALWDMAISKLTGRPSILQQTATTAQTIKKIHKIAGEHPDVRSYCFDRGLASGAVGIIDTFSVDQINRFKPDKDKLPGLSDKVNAVFDQSFAARRGINPTKFTEEQDIACLYGDLGGSTLSSLATPTGLVAGFKLASKLDKGGSIMKRAETAAKVAATVNTANLGVDAAALAFELGGGK